MTIRNLEKLLEPASVALVAGSADFNASTLMRNIVEGGYEGTLRAVIPGRETFFERPCFPRIADLPAPPDLAVVVAGPAMVPQCLDELGRTGCRIAVVATAGLAEAGDAELQQMRDAARPHMLRIIGPDTLGVVSSAAKLNASLVHRAPRAGKIALVSQSAAIATTLIDWAEDREIGFSHIISVGDMADVDIADCLDLLSTDPDTRAVLLYLAGVRSARKFLSAARALARIKPVIAIKAGRTAPAARASATHAGAMAVEDAVMDAALRRAGVLRVRGLSEMFSAAETVARFRPLNRARLAIVTNGGGAGVLAVDRLMEGSGRLAQLDEATIEALGAALPAGWSRGNPVDVLGSSGPDAYEAAVGAVAADRNVDVVMVMNCPTAFSDSTKIAERVAAMTKRGMIGRKPLLSCWLGGATARAASRVLRREGIATFGTPASAAAAVGHLTDWGRAQAALLRVPDRAVEEGLRALPADAAGTARDIFRRVARDGRSSLTEPEAKAVVAAYGIPVARATQVADPAGIGQAAAGLLELSERVAVKLVSPRITHKTDVGGVVLNIATARQAEEAARGIAERVAQAGLSGEVEGYSVEPMIQRPEAQELIIGVVNDATFGPTIVFGAGGIDVEVLRDTAVALPPLDATLAADLIERTRVGKLLGGVRGRAPADAAALQGTLIALSMMVEDFPCLRAVDVNPVLADADGVIALDAAIEIEPSEVERRGPNPALAIRPYPSEWCREVALADGTYELRPIRPADAILYPDFYAKVSPEDMRMRFLAPLARVPQEMQLKLTQIDYHRDMAFIAIAPDGSMAGVSRMVSEPSGKTAEYALMVRSDLAGRGLGTVLMKHLADYARAAGVEVLDGIVLAENRGMLRLTEKLGFVNRLDPEDRGVVTSRLAL